MTERVLISRCRLVFTLLVLLGSIALSVWSALRLHESFSAPAYGDFKRMWAAVGVFWSGGDPYDNGALTAFADARGAGEMIDLPIYILPIGFSYLFPLAIDSFEVVRYCYLGGVALFVFGVWIIPAVIRMRHGDPLRGAISLAALVTFFPLVLMWWVGPLSFWPLLGIAVCGSLIGCEGKVSRFMSGCIVMILLVKPNCAPLVLPFILGFFFASRRWTEVGGVILGGAIGIAGAFMLSTDRPFLELLTESGTWLTPAPVRALGWPMSPLFVRFSPVILGMLWAFMLGARTRSRESFSQRLTLLIVPLGLCLTPFVWTYDFTPLVVTLAVVARGEIGGKGSDIWAALARWAVVGILVLNVLLIASPLAMEFHWWYPLGVLALGVLVYRSEIEGGLKGEGVRGI